MLTIRILNFFFERPKILLDKVLKCITKNFLDKVLIKLADFLPLKLIISFTYSFYLMLLNLLKSF